MRVDMYVPVLFIHSWLRWVVLGVGLWLLVACLRGTRAQQPWSARLERLQVGFLGLLDTQFLLGLLLYFVLSPIAGAARAALGAAMSNPELRFFGIEHPTTMLLAIAIAHVGRVRSKRKPPEARCKSAFVTQLWWLLLTLAAIPWPGLDIARPLFRF